MIPEDAVKAAMSALGQAYGEDAHCRKREYVVTALESAAPHMLIHVHHHDIEHHARSFNEGYETCMAQELADDPTTAQDWLDGQLREARARALEEAAKLWHYNSPVAVMLNGRAATERTPDAR